jgi:hypothetical protein
LKIILFAVFAFPMMAMAPFLQKTEHHCTAEKLLPFFHSLLFMQAQKYQRDKVVPLPTVS